MGYTIEPHPLSKLEDPKISLPRFQRRSAWNDSQNFKLCISVFKEFPTGVMIINKTKDTWWLLDGRQRQNVFIKMREDPVNIYDWASSYIRFDMNGDSEAIGKVFWDKIAEYLQNPKGAKTKKGGEPVDEDEIVVDDESSYDGEEPVEATFDFAQQQESLKTLLDIIIMVHKKSGNELSRWERTFDFRDCIEYLPYVSSKPGSQKRIDRIELKKFILEMNSDYIKAVKDRNITKEYVVEYYSRKSKIIEKKKSEFENKIFTNWDAIKESIRVLQKAEDIFNEAQIGIIWLTNASSLDAQNIFSLVNSGGTQLKAEELLSAKPFWNETVDVDKDVVRKVEELYSMIGLPRPEKIVKWDIPATLISRIDDEHLVFKKYDNEKVQMSRITLGFKLLSAIYVGGMSAKSVSDLEKAESISWKDDVDSIVEDLNDIFDLLLSSDFFNSLHSWGKSMNEILGDAISLEFVTILYKEWKEKGRPRTSSANQTIFMRNAVILFDRLVYEYSTRVWRGSGDSKLAIDLKDFKNRQKAVGIENWSAFIEGACRGIFNGNMTTKQLLTPCLYHYYALNLMKPVGKVHITYEVDHIIPQEKFKENRQVKPEHQNCLSNLSLLPKKSNISKSSKPLNQLDATLKEEISRFTGIGVMDFDKYSDVTNIEDMIEERKARYLEAFGAARNTILSN